MTNILPIIINFVKQLFAKPYVQVAMGEFVTALYMYITAKPEKKKTKKKSKKKNNSATNNCKIDKTK